VIFHCKVEVFPAIILTGVEEKPLMTGGLSRATVIVDDAVVEPALLVAVRLKVMFVVGVIDSVPVEDTVPIP
jgi:hypothetical protein